MNTRLQYARNVPAFYTHNRALEPVTLDEVREAGRSIVFGKAPGTDKITRGAIKRAAEMFPEVIGRVLAGS